MGTGQMRVLPLPLPGVQPLGIGKTDKQLSLIEPVHQLHVRDKVTWLDVFDLR